MDEVYGGFETQSRKERRIRERRFSKNYSDNFYFFLFHNLLSMILFFIFAFSMGLFEKRVKGADVMFGNYYVDFYITTFFLMLLIGLIARVLAYFLMKLIYSVFLNKEIKSFMSLISGINSISINYIITTLIGALLFTIGAVNIIARMVFDQITILTLMGAYILMKIGSYAIVKGVEYIIASIIT